MQSLSSPWAETFEEFARSIRKRAIVVAPFITEQPLERLAYQLDTNNLPQITILTNLAVDSLLQGSVNGQAIADFCKAVPTTTVRHLPGLHAKAYVADEHTAIITSGNLTYNSLHQNYEYGIQISSPVMVREIASDLQEYGNLGAQVSLQELEHIADVSGALRDKRRKAMNSARASLRQEFEESDRNHPRIFAAVCEASQARKRDIPYCQQDASLCFETSGPLTTTGNSLVSAEHPS